MKFAIGCFLLLCVWDQVYLPSQYAVNLENNKEQYIIDAEFINQIEEQMTPGDMIYQLPYHKYPESGSINKMGKYDLMIGYIHSKNLRWSYGGVKGRESDLWNESLEILPLDQKIVKCIKAGFKGIYIDTYAYTDEEESKLISTINKFLKYEPIYSRDGRLVFYTLYPFIENR